MHPVDATYEGNCRTLRYLAAGCLPSITNWRLHGGRVWCGGRALVRETVTGRLMWRDETGRLRTLASRAVGADGDLSGWRGLLVQPRPRG